MTDPRTEYYAWLRELLGGTLPAAVFAASERHLDKLGANKAKEAPAPPAGGLAGVVGGQEVGEASTARKTSQKGIDLIHSFETCKLTAYPDPGSRDGTPWTIGWGSTGPGIVRGIVWTQKQADDRFKADLAKFENGVSKAIGDVPTTQSQFDAMVSLAYNIGINAFAGSTVCRRHKAGEYEGAATAFSMWIKNDGAVLRGLVRRRAAEADLYRGRT